MSPSRRAVLGSLTALSVGSAGCSDEDEPEPGLHAVGVLTLYRAGDGWYDYPDEAGVRVTVENTDVDRHRGTLVVTLLSGSGEEVGIERRDVNLPGGTSRTYEVIVWVGDAAGDSFTADALVKP